MDMSVSLVMPNGTNGVLYDNAGGRGLRMIGRVGDPASGGRAERRCQRSAAATSASREHRPCGCPATGAIIYSAPSLSRCAMGNRRGSPHQGNEFPRRRRDARSADPGGPCCASVRSGGMVSPTRRRYSPAGAMASGLRSASDIAAIRRLTSRVVPHASIGRMVRAPLCESMQREADARWALQARRRRADRRRAGRD